MEVSLEMASLPSVISLVRETVVVEVVFSTGDGSQAPKHARQACNHGPHQPLTLVLHAHVYNIKREVTIIMPTVYYSLTHPWPLSSALADFIWFNPCPKIRTGWPRFIYNMSWAVSLHLHCLSFNPWLV